MAFSKPPALLLLVALSATAMLAAGQGCGGHKVTVQNLCGQDLKLSLEEVAHSAALFPDGWVLPDGKHGSFDVCAWTGGVLAPGAAVAKVHLGHDGGAYYEVSTQQSGPIRVSVTPHGSPLRGHCPTAGCKGGDHCFEHSVPDGDCHGVIEMKIVYYKQ
ncbi:hypothetical protein TRIUR3_11614 [Triticum urartu]|uniref:Uncharacterized protein n=1 Tax=Triticum urartu TaxID=4572 RepID=M8AL44_TRIUA|nr:uncharacterized protein LOC125528087 [Triticum urartu]XP_048560420.1 uncharacterized protein LOC125540945 [Triticum urartu]EMS65795.1 hypothetical protein TRIUR3_11614 [Triticum urartu]